VSGWLLVHVVPPRSRREGLGCRGNRALKQRLVNEGRAHAGLVFEGDVAVGWCQYGCPEELPGIYHRKEYEAGLVKLLDYRLTCLFVDRPTGARESPPPRSVEHST
jgi:hypothetical protein